MDELITSLRQKGVLRSPTLVQALQKIDRKDFVPKELEDLAYIDEALPIGEGQTISQPYTVVFMLELLAPKEGERIIDVGHGSAWQTALLAELVGKHGAVYAIERIETLCHAGKNNLASYPLLKKRVQFFCQDAYAGLPEESEKIGGFDGIIAAAEITNVPPAWRAQLKNGGRLIYPKSGALFQEVKMSEKNFSVKQHPGFVFVPFVTNRP